MNTNVMHPSFQPRMWRMQQALVQVRSRLSMADYFFLFGLWLALLYVADPFGVLLDKIGITKHLPLLASLGGALLINIGALIFPNDPSLSYSRRERKPWQVLKAAWPLALLGLWIVVGSLYARKYEGINNTFITVGLYMLFGLITARVIFLSQARDAIIRAYMLGAVLAGLFIVGKMIVLHDPKLVSYHELEALVIPLAVYFALRPGYFWPTVMTVVFFVGGLLFRKNTGFLVLGVTLIYLWIAEWRFRFRESAVFRFWTVFWIVLIVIIGMVAAGYIVYNEIMPSGNPQYRMRAYEIAWERFLESPAWGTSFSGAGTEKFTGFQIKAARGILPTHSDILDLLAQGGALAFILWLWGYWRIGKLALRYALRGRPRDSVGIAAHTLACMSLTSVLVYAFNPILLQPGKALLLWAQLGMLLGISLHRAKTAADNPEQAATQTRPRKPLLIAKVNRR